jgi:hypothetical protein
MVPTNAILPLVLFMALIFALSMHGLIAAGHFPREHRAPSLQSLGGTTVLFGSLLILIVCFTVATFVAWREIPWYAAIIGAGAMVLLAPLALQKFPDSFVDSRAALVAFAGGDPILALLLILS